MTKSGAFSHIPTDMIQMLNTTSSLSPLPTATGRKSYLSGLPNEILLDIFGYLDVFDSATLALTCKHLADIASTYSKLDLPKDEACKYRAQKPYEAADFLKKRVGDRFFPKRLRYCWGCKIYVPRRKSYWHRKLGEKCWANGRRGRGRDRVTFVVWWALPQTQQMLSQWGKRQAMKCPRCKYCRAGFSLVL